MSSDRRLHDAIADEMLDRLAHDPELSTIRHTVQVTSFGGSGTTTLYEHLLEAGVDVPTTPGSFPFKHQPAPPAAADAPAGFRVVYPFGDPRRAVVSVFRRGFQGGHYRGMRLRTPPPDVEQHLASVESFLDAGVDEFGMVEHFARWRARSSRTYPVMFVRFEDLAGVWREVCDFVGLPAGAPGPRIRARASAWDELPRPLRTRIDEMYGAFAAELAALPPVEVA